uniref:Uncharacterized protein n=1 Tax=Zea mays TaxID=4577 RepID=A0A804MF24_MAIZE
MALYYLWSGRCASRLAASPRPWRRHPSPSSAALPHVASPPTSPLLPFGPLPRRGRRPCPSSCASSSAWGPRRARARRSRPSAAAAARYPRKLQTARARCSRRRSGAPRLPIYSGSSFCLTPRSVSPYPFQRAFAFQIMSSNAVIIVSRETLPAGRKKIESVASISIFVQGDPVWAISQATISDLIGLSLNFFFVLPLLNSEGLFNLVLAWTLLFAPLLFTDCRRDRYKGSLDVLWGFQMFLTNTFLIPYMAIRLNGPEADRSPPRRSQLGSVMVNGAPAVGAVGGLVCVLSIVWAFSGRGDSGFGGIAERWQYLQSYLFSERLAYAFLWDMFLYSVFQPWLIGDNLRNVKADAAGLVSVVRFVPVVGLVAYLLCLEEED